MRQRSLLKIVCLMILITSAVAVSLGGRTKTTHREPPPLKSAKAATKTTAVSRCRLGSVHRCLPTTLGARGTSRLHPAEMST